MHCISFLGENVNPNVFSRQGWSLIELHSWVWHIFMPTLRAKKWDIICLCSLSGSLSNLLKRETAERVYEELRDRVYVGIIHNYWKKTVKKSKWLNLIAVTMNYFCTILPWRERLFSLHWFYIRMDSSIYQCQEQS